MNEDISHNPDIVGVSLRDHDLLVRLDAKMEQVGKDIKEIKEKESSSYSKEDADKLQHEVDRLKQDVINLYIWKNGLVVGITLIWVVVIPLLLYIYFTNTTKQVSDGVTQALSAYDIQVKN